MWRRSKETPNIKGCHDNERYVVPLSPVYHLRLPPPTPSTFEASHFPLESFFFFATANTPRLCAKHERIWSFEAHLSFLTTHSLFQSCKEKTSVWSFDAHPHFYPSPPSYVFDPVKRKIFLIIPPSYLFYNTIKRKDNFCWRNKTAVMRRDHSLIFRSPFLSLPISLFDPAIYKNCIHSISHHFLLPQYLPQTL